MKTTPETMRTFAIILMISVFIGVMLTGCWTTTAKLNPSQVRVYTLAGDVHAEVTGSENTQGGRFQVARKADGTVTLDYTDKGSQWFSMPDFTGENWTIYAGVGLIVAGIAMFFFGITATVAPWVIAGGVALIAFGSWLKTGYAPIVTTGLILCGLAYALYRNRKALVNAVKGLDDEAKAKVYANTDHSDDKIINSIK